MKQQKNTQTSARNGRFSRTLNSLVRRGNRFIDHACLFNRTGRFVEGWLSLADGFILVLGFGFIESDIVANWCGFKMDRRFSRGLNHPNKLPPNS